MARKMSQKYVDEAIAELDKVRDEWMKREGVTALDVGFKFKDGKMTNQLAIRVHVRRKLSPESLPVEQLFPVSLGRFPVDVIEAEYGLQELV